MNDADFNLCQRCGFRSEVLADLGSRTKLVVDLAAIDRRLDHLRQQRSNKSYERQKSALHKLLSSFLASLPVAKSFASASPSDILKFLVWKDKFGKTAVHDSSSPELGQPQPKVLSLP